MLLQQQQHGKASASASATAMMGGFGQDSFRHYMTHKIETQRKQFGVQVPPTPPLSPNQNHNYHQLKQVRFDPSMELPVLPALELSLSSEPTTTATATSSSLPSSSTMGGLIWKLQKRHSRRRFLKKQCQIETKAVGESILLPYIKDFKQQQQQEQQSSNPDYYCERAVKTSEPQHTPSLSSATKYNRPDLFFTGICVLINGYTNPDNETLQRLLQRHGGDVERYETMRVTHIIAQNLSMAKAKAYKKQKRPIPVCLPHWITDSVQAKMLLPYADYLLKELKDPTVMGVQSFFPKVRIDEESGTKPILRPPKYSVENSLKRLRDYNECSITELSPYSNQANDLVIEHEQPFTPEPIINQRIELQDSDHNDDDLIPPYKKTHFGPFEVQETVENKANDSSENSVHPSNEAFEAVESSNNHQIDGTNTFDTLPDIPSFNNHSFDLGKEKVEIHSHAQQNIIANTEGTWKSQGTTDSKYIHGRLRTTGTDPDFLQSFFHKSRLSFIGSFNQRARNSPKKNAFRKNTKLLSSTNKIIFHIDMDSFFASVVLRNYPEYRNKPVAISHNGSKEGGPILPDRNSTSECATCNYIARSFGIEKGMFLGRARELCPDLVVLQYDFEGYNEVSEQVAEILYLHAESFDGNVEQVSCDEAYMELHLLSDNGKSVADIAKGIAEGIREQIFSVTNCTATIGVASNKLLAKLATDKAKPNGCHVVQNYRDLLEPLQLRDLHGIGRRLGRKLASEGLVSIRDIWDLGDRAEGKLCRILGPGVGMKILGFSRGEDNRPVKPADRKTIGAECNYGVRFDGPYGVDYMMHGLAKEIQKRMEGVNVRGSRVTLKIKQRKANAQTPPKFLGHGSCHNHSRSIDTPGKAPTKDWKEFARLGMILLDELAIPKEEIRGMGLTISRLVKGRTMGDETVKGQRVSSFFGESSSDPMGSDGELASHDRSPRSDHSEGSASVAVAVDTGSISIPTPSIQIHVETISMHSNKSQTETEVICIEQDKAITCDEKCMLNNCQCFEQIPPQSPDDVVMDLFVPPTSELHMSQVQAMPSSIREQILSKLKQRVDEHEFHSKLKNVANAAIVVGPEYQQVSMKRMFKLAAVKSGTHTLTGHFGDSLSISQLDSLPLAVQLQIANNDHQSVGTISKRKPVIPERIPQNKGLATSSSEGKQKQASSIPVYDPVKQNQELSSIPQVKIAFDRSLNPRDLYFEDIIPLHKWMDQNADASEGAINEVLAFLSVCIGEGRLIDVVKLLRSIKNRTDAWNNLPFSHILSRVDDMVLRSTGKRLDLKWLGLSSTFI